MIIRICVLLLLYLVASVDKIECRKKSTNITGRHTSHPNPVHLSYGRPSTIRRTTTRRSYIRTTTPRVHHRTTTRRQHITTTRRHHITTTPRFITTTPGRKKTTTRRHVLLTKTTRATHYQTTTPKQQRTTDRVQNRTDTFLTRPPPFNPFFTPSQSKITHTNPPPFNPYFSTTRIIPVSRQPAYNPFFTSTVRPLNSVFNKPTPIPKQPPYNPYFISSVPTVFSSSNKSSMTKPNNSASNFSVLAIPGEFNKTLVTKRPTHNSTPPYNPFFYSTRIVPVSRQPAFNPFFTSTIRPVPNKTTPMPRQPPYNPYFTSSNESSLTKPNNSHSNFTALAIPGESNKTSVTKRPKHNPTFISSGGENGTFITNPNRHDGLPNSVEKFNKTSLDNALVSPKPSVGGFNKTSLEQLGSQTTWESHYPGNGLVQATNRSDGFVYHPPGQKRNVTSNFGQPVHNAPLSNGYLTNPYPSYNSIGNQYPGGSYVPGGQSQQNIGLTIINNNVHNNNHYVVYPTQHYTGYGPPASGVTIVNNNFDYFHNSSMPQYHYTSKNTGNTLLGAFLGYQLGKISRPTYYYYGTSIMNDKYFPVYNHYEIHHYYHNGDKVPQQAEITVNTIVPCAGDSGLLCPQNTSSLCTNNGAVMCVANNTVPCDKDKNLNCVESLVPCSGISARECIQRSATSVHIPCISTAKLSGITHYNHTFVVGRNNSDSAESSVCVTIVALPAKNKLPKLKHVRVEISNPFHYTTNDSGIDPLGYYLGQQLEELESPSYLYLNYDKYYRYKEKYDHYDIHHFYHNATIVPREMEIKPHVVMNCAGDSGTICPQNTRSLCMIDGAVACVTDTDSNTFSNDTKMNYSYVNSSIPCANNTDPMCSNINTTVPIVIPCISMAKIFANMSNLINSFTTKEGITKYYNTLVLQASNTTSNATHQMIPKPRQFCVAVLLTPSEKIKVKAPLKRKVTGVSRSYMAVPTYQYKLEATGNKTLEYYLSNRLGSLKYPTYYYMVQEEAIQKFDHYSVHHYHQGKEIIPGEMDFYAESISACLGDSGTFCPGNTTSLCLNDSSVMCVTDVLLTKPCEKTNGTNCVKSTLPCLDNRAPMCRKGVKRVHVTMPCMSVATVFGDIMYVNNTIYTSSRSDTQSYIDIQRIPKRTANSTAPYDRAQQFCITIIVLPAERKISEGEKLLESSKNVFLNFATNMFGIS